jgi:hypothetical protein
MMAIKKWNDLTRDEKRLWFENSIRMHEDLPTQKRRAIMAKIEKEREKKQRRENRRKPKWWHKK